MKRRQHPIFLFGVFFFGIGLAGVLFFGWGELRLAFLLLIYCLLIIGLRLDEMVRLLEAIEKRLTDGEPVRSPAPKDSVKTPHGGGSVP